MLRCISKKSACAIAGALPGITRARVLAACAGAQLPAHEVRLTVDELRAADEIFVTSAVRGVVPVTKLDGTVRSTGPITTQIAALYLSGLRQSTRTRPERSI